jgi:CheY-like chemotaxis protein
VSNGHDALEEYQAQSDFDVVFLDESMPGITGLETLAEIKNINPDQSVVMITKNEAENIMEEALGAQIDDYLIKPVNPNQILLTLKKIIDNKRLIREKTSSDYQQEFRNILMDINSGLDYEGWVKAYQKIISWEIKISESKSDEMYEILSMQKQEANKEFSKYVAKNYETWISDRSNAPLMSPDLLASKVFPNISSDIPTIFLLLDNLRYDQWKAIQPIVSRHYHVEKEEYFYSILPTSTQYSRNSIFAGMMPGDIAKFHSKYWLDDHEEGGKNQYENELLAAQIKKRIRKDIKFDYLKITNASKGKQLNEKVYNFLDNDLTVIVYNFIDMLSHARTEMEVLKELAGDETAYRSLTRSWFEHSELWSALRKIADRKVQLIIGTDHGTIRVKTPSKVVGDKNTTTNLRYKVGKNLRYDKRDVLEIRDPAKAGLPRPNLSSTFIFAKEDAYFLYPNNYNYYNNYFRDTFQHGGISLEEVICPIIRLTSK